MSVGQVAGLIVAAALVPYIVSILTGRTRPSMGAYLIKSVVAVVAFTSYLAAGGGSAAWTVGVFTLSAVGIFVLSFRYGVGRLTRFDLVCVTVALVGLVVWYGTGEPVVALYASVGVRVVSGLPLLVKLYAHPGTESPVSWGVTWVGEVLNLFALSSLVPAVVLLPVSEALSTSAVVLLIGVNGVRRGRVGAVAVEAVDAV